MLEALAGQTRAQKIREIKDENELILQNLSELEKHHPAKPLSRSEEPTNSLASVLRNAEDQATIQSLSQKKKWLLIAERLEEAHRLGIYNESVNTICRFLYRTYRSVKPNSIRKALPEKYKDLHQSRIAHYQAKGLTAIIYRDHKQKMKLRNTEHVSEENPLEVSTSSSVTPYKDMAHDGYLFAKWLRRSKKRNTIEASLRCSRKTKL